MISCRVFADDCHRSSGGHGFRPKTCSCTRHGIHGRISIARCAQPLTVGRTRTSVSSPSRTRFAGSWNRLRPPSSTASRPSWATPWTSQPEKRSKSALQESGNLYRAIFETTGADTIIIEGDMTLFEKMTGYRREEWEGKKWPEYIPQTEVSYFSAVGTGALSAGTVWIAE